jgi:large subunit ribosomal protein L18Ae
MKQFQVVGRKAPTETDPNPPAYRMKIFAPNSVLAESRFWYFIHTMRKMKRTTGEILDVNEVCDFVDTAIIGLSRLKLLLLLLSSSVR